MESDCLPSTLSCVQGLPKHQPHRVGEAEGDPDAGLEDVDDREDAHRSHRDTSITAGEFIKALSGCTNVGHGLYHPGTLSPEVHIASRSEQRRCQGLRGCFGAHVVVGCLELR
jgi:hypothetical protein